MAESWDLKLARADEHLGEFKRLIAPLLGRRVNPVSKGWETYNQKPAFVYRVRFAIPQPDDRLAVIAGDIMHNIRSALDHAAVALVSPQKQRYASFPIFTCDPDAIDEITGDYLHRRDRRNWNRSVQDMPKRAVAFLKIVQAYRLAENGEDPNDYALALLRTFQDADKHRKLTVVTRGIPDPELFFIDANGARTKEDPPEGSVRPDGLMKDGAIVNLDFRNPPAKVDMEIEGSPQVVIGNSMEGPLRECPAIFDKMMELARMIVSDLATGDWT